MYQMCAMEIFGSFVASILREHETARGPGTKDKKVPEFNKISVKTDDDGFRLSSPLVTRLASAMVNSQLCSQADALLVAVSVTRPYLRLESIPETAEAACNYYEIQRKKNIWSPTVPIEAVLQWAWSVCFSENSAQARSDPRAVQLIASICEHHRTWAFDLDRPSPSAQSLVDRMDRFKHWLETDPSLVVLGCDDMMQCYKHTLPRQAVRIHLPDVYPTSWGMHLGFIAICHKLQEAPPGRHGSSIAAFKTTWRQVTEMFGLSVPCPLTDTAPEEPPPHPPQEDVVDTQATTNMARFYYVPCSRSRVCDVLILAASRGGDVAVVEMLLDDPDLNLRVRDGDSNTPLMLASMYGHADVVKLLVAKAPNLAEDVDKLNRTPLWLAAANGFEQAVTVLHVTGHACPEKRGPGDLSWAEIAARNGHESVIEFIAQASLVGDELQSVIIQLLVAAKFELAMKLFGTESEEDYPNSFLLAVFQIYPPAMMSNFEPFAGDTFHGHRLLLLACRREKKETDGPLWVEEEEEVLYRLPMVLTWQMGRENRRHVRRFFRRNGNDNRRLLEETKRWRGIDKNYLGHINNIMSSTELDAVTKNAPWRTMNERAGYDIEFAQDGEGSTTVLLVAISRGHHDVAELAAKYTPKNMLLKRVGGKDALELATEAGFDGVCDILNKRLSVADQL
jgi:hypothetical protein